MFSLTMMLNRVSLPGWALQRAIYKLITLLLNDIDCDLSHSLDSTFDCNEDTENVAHYQVMTSMIAFFVHTSFSFIIGTFAWLNVLDDIKLYALRILFFWLSLSIGIRAFPGLIEVKRLWTFVQNRKTACGFRLMGTPLTMIFSIGASGSIHRLVYGSFMGIVLPWLIVR